MATAINQEEVTRYEAEMARLDAAIAELQPAVDEARARFEEAKQEYEPLQRKMQDLAEQRLVYRHALRDLRKAGGKRASSHPCALSQARTSCLSYRRSRNPRPRKE